MFTTVAVLGVLTIAGGAPAGAPAALATRARVQVWTNRGEDPYATGQSVRVYFRTDQDAYVTILRVDTDGRVRVLFPRDPWDDNFATGGREYEVLDRFERPAFEIDDYPGEGYIFAVSAPDPFVYDGIKSDDHWDYRVIADGRVRGDPYVALTDLAQRIVPDGYSDWDYDMVPYYVQQHYAYPRFLCYDCHAYASYPYWSAYDYTCVRFRMVVYDDPYYYPYAYGGTQVVFTRPLRPEPRFIFKDRQSGDAFITRVRARPVSGGVGVRGRDLGGTGVIPRPRGGRPGGGDQGGGGQPDHPRDRGQPDRPDQGRDRSDQRSHPDRPDQPGRDRSDQRSHPDRPDQPGRDRSDQRSHPDRPNQPGPDRSDMRSHPDRPNQPGPDRSDQRSHPDRPNQPGPDRSDQRSRPDRPDQWRGALRPDNSTVPNRPDRPAVGDRPSRVDRPSDRFDGGGPAARPGRDNTPDVGRRSAPAPEFRREPAPPPPAAPRNEPRVERAPEPPRERPAPPSQPAPRGEPELKRRKP
ncbi:MAG TPA: DUF4384 domain-containing protein [Gemmatimonadales bacterium]|nr:DUF4384 domain-containing protein [Gemmatimonadales bacterium]